MTHDHVGARLSEYLEGELPLRQRALVDAHLDACLACRDALLDLRAAIDVLHDLGDAEPRGRIADAVMARIRAGETAPTLWSRLVEALESLTEPRIVRPVALAAVGAVVLVAARPEIAGLLGRSLDAAFGDRPGMTSQVTADGDPSAKQLAARDSVTAPRLIGASSADPEPAPDAARLERWEAGFGLPHSIELSRNQASRHMRPILIATPIVPVSRPSIGLRRVDLDRPGIVPLPERRSPPEIEATPVSVPYDGAR
jgi:anti-sigma factor RsiW